jgi:hypothetical protein
MLLNILKAVTYFFGFVLLFAFLHGAQHKFMAKKFDHGQAMHMKKNFEQRGQRQQREYSPQARGYRDRNGNVVRHGFLQHHLHAQDGRIVWQKAADTIEAKVTKESESE